MQSADQQGSWYAVQVQPRRERMVATLLRYKEYETFLPLSYTDNVLSRVRKTISPLIPGYVFCRLDLANLRAPVVMTEGVVRLLSIAGIPAPIKDCEIEYLRMITKSGLPSVPWLPLEIGKKVLLSSGPLTGLTGSVSSHDAHHKLIVEITLLHRRVAVEIAEAWVSSIV